MSITFIIIFNHASNCGISFYLNVIVTFRNLPSQCILPLKSMFSLAMYLRRKYSHHNNFIFFKLILKIYLIYYMKEFKISFIYYNIPKLSSLCLLFHLYGLNLSYNGGNLKWT